MSSASGRVPGDPVLRARDERLEALKAVVGKLAHDFNNFLAPQYGYLTMLKDEAAMGSTVAMYIGAMETAARKAEGYISSILLGMRPYRQCSPREFRFHALLDETLNRWMNETPAGKEVRLARDFQEFNYCGDEKQWRIVFDHLLSNARYALAMGGELEVSLRRQRISGEEVQRLGMTTDDLYCLRVRDTGFGMSPQAVERAFDPFFTTRTQIKASGLGLTVVHGITLFHGGQVELESIEDRGTTVTIWLPPEPVWQRHVGLSALMGARSTRKVLLIEDDPLIREVLRTWIVNHQLEVESATNEGEARRALERSGGDCRLILCEADLQSGKGEEIYRNLSGVYPSAAWVLLAGARKPDFASEAGRDEPMVIKKPFSHNAFSDLLRKFAGP